MLTGELRSQIDRIWNDFWSGGISNPLEVIEQLTYLLFIKRLDDLQTLAENKARALGEPVEHPVFPEGVDDRGRSYEDYRWRQFKNLAPAEMFQVVDQHVFPFLRTLGGEGSTYESPFTDVSPQGPDALFNATQMGQLLGVVADVRRRADAA